MTKLNHWHLLVLLGYFRLYGSQELMNTLKAQAMLYLAGREVMPDMLVRFVIEEMAKAKPFVAVGKKRHMGDALDNMSMFSEIFDYQMQGMTQTDAFAEVEDKGVSAEAVEKRWKRNRKDMDKLNTIMREIVDTLDDEDRNAIHREMPLFMADILF